MHDARAYFVLIKSAGNANSLKRFIFKNVIFWHLKSQNLKKFIKNKCQNLDDFEITRSPKFRYLAI